MTLPVSAWDSITQTGRFVGLVMRNRQASCERLFAMRQGQKNNRMRGRGRKPANPLSRSYDSNGPDVKIRGTASHIAEKYQSLARDALASGDIVMAENYYQHAEHYLRIIASAQAANRDQDGRQQGAVNGSGDQPDIRKPNRKQRNANAVEASDDNPQPSVEATDSSEAPAAEADAEASTESPGISAAAEEDAPQPVRRRRRAPARPRKRASNQNGAAKSSDEGAAPVAVSMPDAPQPVVSED